MRRIFLIGFALFFSDNMRAGTHLKDIPGATKQEEASFTVYTVYTLKSESIKIRFPSDGKQPSAEVVSWFATPRQELFPWLWCKELLTLLNFFEGEIPKDFEILIQNPLGRALLYRICIELLRVNDEEEPCFPDGTAKPEKSIKKFHFSSTDCTAPCFRGLSPSEILFFKLLEYFHALRPKREIEALKSMLCATHGEAEIERHITCIQGSPSVYCLKTDEAIISFLFTLFGVSCTDVNRLPGDELSLTDYQNSNLPQKGFYDKILKQGYNSDAVAIKQRYTLNITLEHKRGVFVVYLNNELAFPCSQISHIFEYIYKFFYDSLDYFEPGISVESLEIDPKGRAYDRWCCLMGKIHSFYTLKAWHPYVSTPAMQQLYYTFHINVKKGDGALRSESFTLFYDYKNNISFMSPKDFWEPFEDLVSKLLK